MIGSNLEKSNNKGLIVPKSESEKELNTKFDFKIIIFVLFLIFIVVGVFITFKYLISSKNEIIPKEETTQYNKKENIKLEIKIEEKEKSFNLQKEIDNIDSENPANQYYIGKRIIAENQQPINYEEAVKWFTLSASQGHKEAQEFLGILYYKGEVIPKDYNKALFFLTLAAQQQQTESQFILGKMFELGNGTIQDLTSSRKWYRLASLQGHTEALKKIKELETKENEIKKNQTDNLLKEDPAVIEKYLNRSEKKNHHPTREIIWNN
jgi:biopolymer transport protein ExbD